MEAKYDRIGHNYNQTRQADPYLLERLYALLSIEKGASVLDIGCGSGNYTRELAEKGLRMTGVDPSAHMLSLASAKSMEVNWMQGSAEQTGLKPDSFAGITAFLTLHHWTNLEVGFKEMYGLLQPGGKMVIFSSTPEQMQGYWLTHYFPQMLADSGLQMPAFEKVEKDLRNAGFEQVEKELYEVKEDLQDHFLYCGKNRPQLYFRPDIRQGISSFSDLSRAEEVQNGLTLLKADLESEKWEEVRDAYTHEDGDYVFIVAEKS